MIELEVDDSLEPPKPDSMTPMIDVIFSLIAFMMLMINAPLLAMKMDLPEVEKQPQQSALQGQAVTLTILPKQWKLADGPKLDREMIVEQLRLMKLEQPELKVTLSTDKTTEVQRMVDAIALLNELKIEAAQVALSNASLSKAQ